MSEENKTNGIIEVGMVVQNKPKNPSDPDEPKKYHITFNRQTRKNQQTGKYEPFGPNPFPLTINEGDVMFLKSKPDELKKMVSDGKISQDVADNLSWMRFTILKPFKNEPNEDGPDF